jgi:hypothetical protein
MNNYKRYYKNFISFFMIFILLSFSCFPLIKENVIGKNITLLTNYNNDCYGFIIPLPLSNDISENPDIQYSTMNLINDLLRLNASIYWSSNPISIETKTLSNNNNQKNEIFQQGTFIIPFSGDELIDSRIIPVIYDYNVSHELHKNNTIPVNLSMIMEPFTLENSYKLVEPNIAYYYGDGVYSRSLDWYVYTLYKSGFLDNEFLYDNEVINKLNSNVYNVFIWPGGEIIEDINSDINIITRILKQNKIRRFVSEGGGFVGSCYGAFAASSGIRFLPFTLLNYYYPIIPSIGYLSIQDCTTALAISCTFNISVSNIDNPVIYGADDIIYNSQLRGGAVFTWLGENTQSLATIKEVNTTIWTHWFRDLFSSNSSIADKIIELWIKFTNQKTIWTTSEYNKGKVVTFGDHPELGHINLKRIVHNAIFYVSSEEINRKNIDYSYGISDIESIFNKSNKLEINDFNSNLFSDIYDDIYYNIEFFEDYNKKFETYFDNIWGMIDTDEMNFSFAIEMFVSGLWEFFTTINRSKNYFYNSFNDDNTIDYLRKLDSINNQFDSDIVSIDDLIIKLKNNISNKMTEITLINNQISEDLSLLDFYLNNYENSDIQNESIINLCSNLWAYSKKVNKYSSSIFFNSLKILRESWYTYESIID